ncbi:serine/threonine protein kinase [Mycobacterium liflandii]|nr:hypothetical protein MMSP_0577 [Mycobacterium sp. 012931]EPQ72386.1 hypothetical protein MMEU_3768 [Mycobacterium marinum str. Europe]ULL08903.1 serine/threonine protein kinase [Mycobacterium liflandii]GAQ35493.1 hypothetical protein MPS_2704 [Mycobacterium pseudoshottsii JCM 15466]
MWTAWPWLSSDTPGTLLVKVVRRFGGARCHTEIDSTAG